MILSKLNPIFQPNPIDPNVFFLNTGWVRMKFFLSINLKSNWVYLNRIWTWFATPKDYPKIEKTRG